jgi:hypothetical protein
VAIPVWFGLTLLLLAACAAPSAPTASRVKTPAMAPGTARVWFLRQANPPVREVEAATPTVFANGAPIAQSAEGTAFFHDFPPGTYRFTVQAYGTPTGRSDTFQLVAGSQTFLQVQAEPNWEQGSTAGGWSFTVMPLAPQDAQQYLPTITDLGQR